jgi:hypothetical protein
MKLALIPPHSRITDTAHTNYQLVLAHILAEPSVDGIRYAKEYMDRQERGDHIILDNGAYEGKLVRAKVLVDLANDLLPNEIVIPDSMRNAELTQAMAQTFLEDQYRDLDWRVGLMFVAQGSSYKEFEDCIHWATEQDWIDTIAIPRHTLATCEEQRARLDLAIWTSGLTDKAIHFLGASPLWTEEIRWARDSGIVRGMDTSMPYVYGFSYERWPSDKVIDSADSRSFYFDLEGDSEQNEIITQNVKGMVDVVNEL